MAVQSPWYRRCSVPAVISPLAQSSAESIVLATWKPRVHNVQLHVPTGLADEVDEVEGEDENKERQGDQQRTPGVH